MIRAIIIDDEKNALEVLQIQLKEYCADTINVLASISDSREGILAIKRLKPDVIFMDIEMPYKNGFDVINETSEVKYNVIFTTAYSQFAIKAFKVAAIDYLLKPIDANELVEAVSKLKLYDRSDDFRDKIESLINNLNGTNQTQPKQKIALTVGDTIQFFNPDDIIRFESDSNYTHIHLNNGRKLTTAKTLKDVETKLKGTPFYRVHSSNLINMHHIERHVKGNAGYVIMVDGSKVTISRSRKDEFLEKFWKI